jgi:predicted lipoprotein with Yx(FWY)xxD motif
MNTFHRLVVLSAGATLALGACGSDSNTTTQAGDAAADSAVPTLASPATTQTPTTVYSGDGSSDTVTVASAPSSTAATIKPATPATKAAPTTAASTIAATTASTSAATTASTTGSTTPTTTTTTGAATKGTVNLGDTALGKVLVNADGRTLYLFTKDTATSSACSGGCASAWPPLTASGTATAGAGLDASKLGTLTRADGGKQVTYGGNPLYTYEADQAAGDVTGHQVGSVWYAIGPDGKAASGGGGTGY